MNESPVDRTGADFAGDRGMANVGSAQGTLGRFVKIILVSVAFLGATAAIASTWFAEEEVAKAPERTVIASNVPDFTPVPVIAAEPAPEPAPVIEPEPLPELPQVQLPPVPSQEDLERVLRRRAKSVVFGGNAAAVGAEPGSAGGEAFAGDELSAKLTATPLPGVVANRLADNGLMIARGTHLDCTLETAIDTTQPGFTSCILARDMFGFNGKVLLLEKGSKITGQYQGGIKQGQSRIFVLWTRIATPNGVLVNLDSPGTDALGRSGHEGYVDAHFFERFGGALLLSIVDDALQIAGDRIPGGPDDVGVDVSNTSAAGKDAATVALENSINIAPTLYKNQGERISIFVARDLDFRGVYELRRNVALK